MAGTSRPRESPSRRSRFQQPHPPVYIASNSADTFNLVGQLGHNILVAPTIVSVQGALTGLETYRAELEQNGHDPATRDVNVTVHVNVAEDEAKARNGFEMTINNYLGTLRTGSSRGSTRAQMLDYETVLDEYAAVGTPEQVTEKLGKYREMYGPGRLHLLVQHRRDDPPRGCQKLNDPLRRGSDAPLCRLKPARRRFLIPPEGEGQARKKLPAVTGRAMPQKSLSLRMEG